MKKLFLFLFAITASLFWSGNVHGQITQVGSSTSATSTGSSITINKPTGIQVGDVMIAIITENDNSGGTDLGDGNGLSGWSLISESNLAGTNPEAWGYIYYKVAVASDVTATNYAFDLDNDSDGAVGAIFAFTGVDATGGVNESGAAGGPFDIDPGTINNIATDATLNANSITTASVDAAVIMLSLTGGTPAFSNWSTTSPGALAEIVDANTTSGADCAVGAAWAIKSVAGSTGAGSGTLSVSVGNGSLLIALKKGVPPAPPTPIGCNGQYYVSYGSGGTASATTSMSKLAFSGGLISANPFSTDPTGIGFNGIGINPVDGFLYGVRYAPAHLVRVAANTPGNIVDLGTISNASLASGDNVYAGCFDINGDYFFISDANELYKISGINYPAAPLAATFLGTVSPTSGFFVDIAIDPTDGQLYGVAGTGASNKNLYTINKANGALTFKGTYSGSNYIAALFFDEVGTLFGYRQDGTFQQINKANAAQTQVGTAPAYTYADGCSCSFGRVFHDLDFTANAGNQVCPTIGNPNPSFPLQVSVTNQSNIQQTGLTYTLNISDPSKRFRFTESAATIKANLITAGVATNASTVTLSTEAPATGTNYNKVVVTGFQTGTPTQTLQFILQVQLYTLGNGAYDPVPLQSEITGLPVIIGSSDLSNDPGTIAPDDPTTIIFCPNIALPVQLTSFTAKRNNTMVNLKWATSMELNNTGFYIERKVGSSDNWETIGFVATQAQGGNSNDMLQYSYNDLNAAKAITQYRLRQVDFDAKATYSVIRSVRGEGQLGKTIVYPNPSNNGVVNVVFEDAAVTREIAVSDMSGRLVRQIRAISNNNITIENLNPGMYTIRIVAIETGEQVVEKVVVNKR